MITKTLGVHAASEATHWSTRSMARLRSGLTQTAVSRIWRAFGLQPHRQETLKLSKDPLFVEKVHDVVGLYLNPPERAVVLCVDEKSQIQALDRTAPILPMLPGTPQRATHDYKRAGTSSLYAALDITTGRVIGGSTPAIARSSSSSSCRPSTGKSPPTSTSTSCWTTARRTRRRRSRNGCSRTRAFVLHFTPTSASWLNLVERWFAELTTKLLKRGTHRSVRASTPTSAPGSKTWNDDPRPYVWTKTADQILDSISPLLRTNQRLRTLRRFVK